MVWAKSNSQKADAATGSLPAHHDVKSSLKVPIKGLGLGQVVPLMASNNQGGLLPPLLPHEGKLPPICWSTFVGGVMHLNVIPDLTLLLEHSTIESTFLPSACC